jgi:hypothetical protein
MVKTKEEMKKEVLFHTYRKVQQAIEKFKENELLIEITRHHMIEGITVYLDGENYTISAKVNNDMVEIMDEGEKVIYTFKDDGSNIHTEDEKLEIAIINYLEKCKSNRKTANLFKENKYFFNKYVNIVAHDASDEIYNVVSKLYKNDEIERHAASCSEKSIWNHVNTFSIREAVHLFRFLNEYFVFHETRPLLGTKVYSVKHFSFDDREKAMEFYKSESTKLKEREIEKDTKQYIEKNTSIWSEKI